jgi:hypothetical protein|tara:strand:+ start:15971 stop:16174 length:204 start_codon:yes stop_codon:yes gene_type:complete
MRLRDCTYGVLVYDKDYGLGMIVGVTNNCHFKGMEERSKVENTIPLVKWASGAEFGIHPSNIEIYKG